MSSYHNDNRKHDDHKKQDDKYDDHKAQDGKYYDNDTEYKDSYNSSDDDVNVLSGNQTLSGFQLTLIGDNDDNGGAGLLFWS